MCTTRSVFFAVLFCFPAFAGSLRTRDGNTYQGQITPAAGNALIITPAAGAPVTVEWVNVAQAVFADPPAALNAITLQPAQHGDLGKVHLAGSTIEKEGSFSITGSGWGAWGPRDSGQFAWWPLEGDGQIIAHVASYGDEGGDAMAGVMLRATLEPDAKFAASLIYPSGETRFNRRPIEGYAGGPERRLNPPQPGWVRLARNGNLLTAYHSKDGRFWQPVRGQIIDLPAKTCAGLFVANGTNSHASTANFDHVQLLPGTPGATYFEGAVGPPSGLVLVDGSMLAGYPKSLADGMVLLLPARAPNGTKIDWPRSDIERAAVSKLMMTFPRDIVARIRFSPEPPDLTPVAPSGTPGVLLVSGDFMDGDIEHLAYPYNLDIQSVVFGSKRIEAPRDVICAILHEAKPEKAAYEVRLQDGSILQAKAVGFEGETAVVETALAGVLKISVRELASVITQH